VSDQLEERVSVGPEELEGTRQSHVDVGGRVAEVIRAAEELAEQIAADARAEAARIKREAEESHAAAMRELAIERDELRAAAQSAAEGEAAEIRRTGEIYAKQQRRQAEAEHTKLVDEAEGQARAMREAAEQMAMQIETTALQRRDELEEHTRVVEMKLRRFQMGLREMSKDLNELLEPRRGKSETLVDALNVDQRPGAQP
jgi:hypothetical protein